MAAPDLAVAAPTDEELVDRLRKGDREAFEHLYDRYLPRIYQYVDRRLRNRADTEETVQEVFFNVFNSIEGFRGEPRNKPPYPTTHGLFGQPTAVNNTETLVNVLSILVEGPDAYRSVGTAQSPGTRLFSVSGRVVRPGLYEVPFGTTLGELLDLAGGATGELAAVLLGGAAGSFVPADQLGLRLTLEDTRQAGVALGSGAVVVFDTSVDLTDTVLRIASFFTAESCGQCVPCRVATVRQHETLVEIAKRGEVTADQRELLGDLSQVLVDASICGLGHTAASAVQSALRLGLVGGGT